MSAQLVTDKFVALVIYEELTPFDPVGPLQVFTALQEITPEYRVVVVAERKETITSDAGLKSISSHTFDEVPHPFAVLVPGGNLPTIRSMCCRLAERPSRYHPLGIRWSP
jgi:hypothetical protein